MIRLATGDLSALHGCASRAAAQRADQGWMGRADQTTKVKGMFVRPELVIEWPSDMPRSGGCGSLSRRAGEQTP